MSEIRVDTISEKTSANGVAVDGLTIKDGGVAATAASTITTASADPQLTIISTEAGGGASPIIDLYRNSSSPADDDVLGQFRYYGENSADEKIEYVRVKAGVSDVTDGTEDSNYTITTFTGGSQFGRLNILPTETVFNENSTDVDFRIESNGNANMLFVDGGNDFVGIGTASPARALHVSSGAENVTVRFESTDAAVQLEMKDSTGTAIIESRNDFRFTTGGSETMRLDTSGRLLIGTTDIGYSDYGDYLTIGSASGQSGMTIRSGTSNYGTFYFSDATGTGTGTYAGKLQYNHSDNSMRIATNSVDRLFIDSAGAITMPHQPAFLASPASQQSNLANNTTLLFATEITDRNADYNGGNGTFTAPITGLYQVGFSIRLQEVPINATYVMVETVTSNRSFYYILDPGVFDEDAAYWEFNGNYLIDMDANDTYFIRYIQSGGNTSTDMATSSYSFGTLAC